MVIGFPEHAAQARALAERLGVQCAITAKHPQRAASIALADLLAAGVRALGD
jgi:hypothetical protein